MLARLRKGLALVPAGMGPRFAALVPLAVLTVAFEAIGAAAVFGLIRIVTEPAQAATMPVAGTLVRWLPPLGDRGVIVAATVLVAMLFAAKNALVAVTTYLRNRLVEEATATTSAAMLRIYLGAPYSFHLRRNSAELIYNAEQAVQRVFGTVMASAVGVATEVVVALGIFAVLVVAAPRVTVVTATALIAVSWLFLGSTRRTAVALGRRLDALHEATLRHLQQALGGAKEIKVLGRGQYFADAFERDQRALARVRWLYGTFAAMPRIVVETVFVAGALLVILLTTLGGGTATESVPLLGLYAYAGFRVIPSANRIVWLLSEIRVGSPAIDRVHADLVAARGFDTGVTVVSEPRPLREQLELERVSYAYEGSDRPVLEDVSLTIRRGESIGIVGTTGIGKTTLVDLIVGLLVPIAGNITVDGADIRTCLAAWQRQIGYVPQTLFLIDDTLRRNIALGVADADIDETHLRAALCRAQLDAYVAALPRGLDTVVGERGVRLSGGERQRIGIARALYHEPSVLVFDEATSALDSRTEAELAEAIDALRIDRTLIIVAHRLTTVRRCDRLVFLADGRVADVGTFDELAARNVAFRDMAAAGAG